MTARVYNNWNNPPEYYQFDPSSLMTFGDGSIWYDMGDWNTMFTDVAMTTKVTAAGQTVAAMLDKGPNGYHLTQPTSAKRPTVAVVGGFKCLDFASAAAQNLYSVSTTCDIALDGSHGFNIFETDDAAQFHRILSVTSGGSDTAGATAFCTQSGTTATIFGIRSLNAAMDPGIAGTGVTPLDIYEYEANGANSATVWKAGAGAVTDAAHVAMSARSNGRIAIGTSISANVETAVGCMEGRIYNIVHLGNIPSSPNRTKVYDWLNAYRV